MLKAIFFDLGSTLWDDQPLIHDMWENVAQILTQLGVPTTPSDMEADSRAVIASYSPSLTRSIVWHRLNGNREVYNDVMDEIARQSVYNFDDPDEFRRLNPLFPSTIPVLEELSPRYPLGVISQHFVGVRRWIGYHGIQDYFRYLAISNELKLYKPDTRLFLHACRALAVEPGEAVMVGDRLDNDIFPANRLGMTTVRIRHGIYSRQRERYSRDAPDYTIEDLSELPGVVERIAGLS